MNKRLPLLFALYPISRRNNTLNSNYPIRTIASKSTLLQTEADRQTVAGRGGTHGVWRAVSQQGFFDIVTTSKVLIKMKNSKRQF